MIGWVLKKIMGSRNERVIKRIRPLVAEINRIEQGLQLLTDEQLQAKTEEFRTRLKNGETTDDILCEAYAVVKNACRRLCGREIEVTEHKLVWDMVPFDVQLIGGIILHRGGIAEMATGEGKTLVSTMPLYLNALTGRSVHLVTVNDYLAMRDSQWMGAVFKFLGLTVGCIQNQMPPPERREHYACDITYGTNSEFGFDYLRDMGMADSKEHMVQRGHYFAIVDEIDSILIDEARTPLIIAGPSAVSSAHRYDKLKPAVAELYQLQTRLVTRLVQEAKDVLEKADAAPEDRDAALVKLVQVRAGMPKHKQLLRLLENPTIRKQLDRAEMSVRSDTNRGYFQKLKEDLFFAMDERNNESDLTDKGRRKLAPDDPDAFVIPDLGTAYHEIDTNMDLSAEEKVARRQAALEKFEETSETIHNISQLLRAYCLFEKDVGYVVQDNKVLIVDEHTGRLMPGRRFSDGLHQALESKEDVQIERETQTLATITIQNYFRLYEKLAGMTGTAETEATEFKEIYKLDVAVVPTNRPCIRKDSNDRIFKTKREKYNAVIEEIEECNKRGQPVLVGTISVDDSEVLSRMLQRRKIVHNVLNAKNHQFEAEIVSRAGQLGAVTIATNMAGRGTDIKLGPGVKEVGGLHVIASARHDSRRIDRQLRGRCSRQGDPGSSRFYVSLEDDLMRLFGSDRIAGIMERLGMKEGEELSHSFLNTSIERAQRRVEQHHFGIRKRTLQYDDVMNKQRQVIYGLRQQVLMTDNTRDLLFDFVFTTVCDRIEAARGEKGKGLDAQSLFDWLTQTFPIGFELEEITPVTQDGEVELLGRKLADRVDAAYQLKEKNENPEAIRWLERRIMLDGIDTLWQEHLFNMDQLRHSIQLRAYGQRDPLVEYKQEAFRLFSTLTDEIKDRILSNMFRSATTLQAFQQIMAMLPMQEMHESYGQFGDVVPAQTTGTSALDAAPLPVEAMGGGEAAPAAMPQEIQPSVLPPGITLRRELPKVGRNDQCPCGSGKKFKQCCGR
jgi:preprotein translocase subunit SecA